MWSSLPDPLSSTVATALLNQKVSMLKSAIATAEGEGVVDAEVIKEAKVLLARQMLRSATERRDVAGLRAAITVAESEAEADRATIEASGT